MKLIVAVDRGGSIGWKDGRLPWRLPLDMKRFKELTTGSTVVMGFNTFVSLGRPEGLPNRKNFVLTRKNPLEAAKLVSGDVSIISDLKYFGSRAVQDTWVIGGASVYAEALRYDMIDEAYITLVDTISGGDVKLPIDFQHWKHWVVTEANQGRDWISALGSTQLDNEVNTTYLYLKRVRNVQENRI